MSRGVRMNNEVAQPTGTLHPPGAVVRRPPPSAEAFPDRSGLDAHARQRGGPRRRDPGISITRAAELTRTTVRALRHYEDLGLLAPLRTPGNKRLFSQDQVDRARMIAELRRLGVAIHQIGPILSPTVEGDRGPVVAVIRGRLDDLRRQVAELESLLDGLGEAS